MDEKTHAKILELREAISEFVRRFKCAGVVDRKLFSLMHEHAQDLSRLLQGTEMVSKFLLADLYSVPDIIRSDAPYLKEDKQELEDMAQKMELCFAQILGDCVPDGRITGDTQSK